MVHSYVPLKGVNWDLWTLSDLLPTSKYFIRKCKPCSFILSAFSFPFDLLHQKCNVHSTPNLGVSPLGFINQRLSHLTGESVGVLQRFFPMTFVLSRWRRSNAGIPSALIKPVSKSEKIVGSALEIWQIFLGTHYSGGRGLLRTGRGVGAVDKDLGIRNPAEPSRLSSSWWPTFSPLPHSSAISSSVWSDVQYVKYFTVLLENWYKRNIPLLPLAMYLFWETIYFSNPTLRSKFANSSTFWPHCPQLSTCWSFLPVSLGGDCWLLLLDIQSSSSVYWSLPPKPPSSLTFYSRGPKTPFFALFFAPRFLLSNIHYLGLLHHRNHCYHGHELQDVPTANSEKTMLYEVG